MMIVYVLSQPVLMYGYVDFESVYLTKIRPCFIFGCIDGVKTVLMNSGLSLNWVTETMKYSY